MDEATKKKVDIWMPIYIGDYMADTMHLDATSHGVYLMLIMHYWKSGPLPDNEAILMRIARCEKEQWGNAWSIVQAFFKHEPGIFRHTRIEAELSRWRGRKTASAAKAKAAADARWGKNASSIAPSSACSNDEAILEQCPSPSPSPLPLKEKLSCDPRTTNDFEYSPEFENCWVSYPARAGGNPKRDAFKAWGARIQEGHNAAELLAGTKRYAEFCDATGKRNTEFVMQAVKFFGRSKRFLELWVVPSENTNQHPSKDRFAGAL